MPNKLFIIFLCFCSSLHAGKASQTTGKPSGIVGFSLSPAKLATGNLPRQDRRRQSRLPFDSDRF